MGHRVSVRRTGTVVLTAGLLMSAHPIAAEERPSDLQSVAVTIQRQPPQSWAGYGIFLGGGLVLTAAHVAGRGILTHPAVVIAGQMLATETVKEGSYPDNDLAVLRIAAPWPSELDRQRVTICADPPRPGEAVVVVTPEAVTNSAVISPDILPQNMRSMYAASIKDVYTTGNSGSGVFDADSHCLLGIMSSKIEQEQIALVDGKPTKRTVGLAKHFVPQADIKAFLADLPQP